MSMKKSSKKSALVLLVLIIMLMLGLIYVNNKNIISSAGTKAIKSLTLIGELKAQDKDSTLCSVDDMLAEASGTVVKLRNAKGEEVWSKTLAGKVLSMKSEGSGLYILDSSKNLYYVAEDGKNQWDKQLEGEIKNIYTDKSGDVLIEYAYNSGTKVDIFSKKGIDEGSMVLENAAVLAFASGKDENTLSVVDISSDIIKTKIITLNLRGDMVWSDNLDNQIIPLLGYSKNNTLIAVGEKAIYKYTDKNKKQNKADLNKTIYNAGISEEGVAVAVRSKNGFEVLTYDWNLKALKHLDIEDAPSGIILDKNNYILYYDENLFVGDLKGSIKAEYKSMPEIKKAYFAGDGNIISVSDRSIQILGYK